MFFESTIEVLCLQKEVSTIDDASMVDEIINIMNSYEVEDDIHAIVAEYYLNGNMTREDRLELDFFYLIIYTDSEVWV